MDDIVHKVERMAGTSANGGVCMWEHQLSQALMLADIQLEILRLPCMHEAGAGVQGIRLPCSPHCWRPS